MADRSGADHDELGVGGVIAALPTFFSADYAYDPATMRRQIDRLLAGGVHGLFVLSSVGEFLHFKTAERRNIAVDVLSHVGGRVPVIVGTGSASTLETIELTQHAAGAGARAAAVLNPTAWHLEEEALLGHYASVANAVDLPILVYNVPRMSGVNIRTELVERLMIEHENIRGLIDVTDSLSQMRKQVQRLKALQPNNVVLTGRAEHLLDLLLMGGDGAISGNVNLTMAPAIRLWEAFKRDDHAAILRYQGFLLRMAGLEGIRGAGPSVLKEAMAALGLIDTATTRPPAFPLNAEARAAARQFVEDLRALLADEPGALERAPAQ